MDNINRRKFLDTSLKMVAGMAGSALVNGLKAKNPPFVEAIIPMPIQVVIDDVGWWSGQDGHEKQEPYRTGIHRNHVPADYQAIVDLGKMLNIRPQAAMILCEWDTQNILCKLPTSTWMGGQWNNKKWVGPWLEEAADIIRNNKKHFELTLHGIGHEYWTNGVFTRAEWADKDGVMRPENQVHAHLDFYNRLLEQHQLGPFPTAFVPTAFLHGFGSTPGHEVSMAHILNQRGIFYINTPFEDMRNAESVQFKHFGFDGNVITVDRGRDLLSWKSIGMRPEGELNRPTCGLHWPNLLHSNPDRNSEIVEAWIRFLKPYQYRKEKMLSANSDVFLSQLVHFECTKLAAEGETIQLDFSGVDIPTASPVGKCFYIKVVSSVPLDFTSYQIEIVSVDLEKQNSDLQYRLELNRISDKLKSSVKCTRKV